MGASLWKNSAHLSHAQLAAHKLVALFFIDAGDQLSSKGKGCAGRAFEPAWNFIDSPCT